MVTLKKILCAVDFSEYSPHVAEYAKMLAERLNAKLIVLYAAPSLDQYVGFHVPPASIDNFVSEIVEGAEKTMQEFINEHFAGLEAEGMVITGYASEEILNTAEEQEVDLIIMGTHGRKGIDRILFGSVAEKVVVGAKCPVLTVRPQQKQ